MRQKIGVVMICLGLLVWGLFPTVARSANRTKKLDQRLEYLALLSNEVYWQNLKRQRTFYIELLGTHEIFNKEVVNYFQRHKVQGKEVEVVVTPSWEKRDKAFYPNLIFVSSSYIRQMPLVCKAFENYAVLVVSETAYKGVGWMASIVPDKFTDDGVVLSWKMQIDDANIVSYAGLSVSSKLLPKLQDANFDALRVTHATPAPKPVVDYPVLVEKQQETIVAQEKTIVQLRDTVVLQQKTIDSLRVFNEDVIDWARQGVLWTKLEEKPVPAPMRTKVESHLRDQVKNQQSAHAASLHRGKVQQPRTTCQVVNTAPWKGRSFGYALLFALVVLSLASVFVLTLFVGTGAQGGGIMFSYVPEGETTLVGGAMQASVLGGVAHRRNKHELEETFLGNVSHELRTPLNAIVGLSQYIASAENVDEEVRESLEIINSNAHGLMQMMNSILTLSMLQRKEMVLQVHPVDVNLLFSELNLRIHQQILFSKRTKVDVSSYLDTEGDGVFVSDAEKLRMVLELLLSLSILNPRTQIIEFGAVGSAAMPIFYVRAGENSTQWQKLVEKDFSFSAAQHYQPVKGGRDISLDTVSALIDLMGGELYVDSDRFKQMYYFCVVEGGDNHLDA